MWKTNFVIVKLNYYPFNKKNDNPRYLHLSIVIWVVCDGQFVIRWLAYGKTLYYY